MDCIVLECTNGGYFAIDYTVDDVTPYVGCKGKTKQEAKLLLAGYLAGYDVPHKVLRMDQKNFGLSLECFETLPDPMFKEFYTT